MTSADTMPAPTPEHRAREAHLLDLCREAEALVYGRRVELCIHAGLKDQAHHWRREMEAVVQERRDHALQVAEDAGEDYFVAAGRIDSMLLSEAK